ncbi:MAG: T9SS type A sorting domain-containing protein [Bacteroidales bacterium]|nr:T9SS type A sorting domain-containing protein [Bacteroidales bacterium]
MKKQILTFLLLLAALHSSAQERVLFVGNSLTYYNEMPQLFAGIANDKGFRVEVDSYTVGGTGLAEMLASGEVQRLIESERWDKMVLQPGTGESAGLSIPTDSTASVVRQLVAALRAVNPDAKVCLYEISNGITPGDGSGDYDYYLSTQQRILDSVTKIARLAEVPFAPAGECFREHYAAHHDLMLHSVFNDIHPNAAGSYLVACAIFETLYEVPVASCDYYGDLDEEQAEYLQQIADTVVLPNRERWLMGPGEDPEDPQDPDSLSISTIKHSNNNALNLYPNPTTGLVHIEATEEVTIYDLKGNKTQLRPQSGTLDLTSFATGVYILQVGSHRQKLIITRP